MGGCEGGGDLVPDVVGLGEAVEEEKGLAAAGLDAVDYDCGMVVRLHGDVEFFETFEHFELYVLR